MAFYAAAVILLTVDCLLFLFRWFERPKTTHPRSWTDNWFVVFFFLLFAVHFNLKLRYFLTNDLIVWQLVFCNGELSGTALPSVSDMETFVTDKTYINFFFKCLTLRVRHVKCIVIITSKLSVSCPFNIMHNFHVYFLQYCHRIKMILSADVDHCVAVHTCRCCDAQCSCMIGWFTTLMCCSQTTGQIKLSLDHWSRYHNAIHVLDVGLPTVRNSSGLYGIS